MNHLIMYYRIQVSFQPYFENKKILQQSPLCHLGTRWSMCGHSAAFPASRQALQARVTLNVEKIGRFVVLSRILSSRVKKLISLVTVEMARRLVVPTISNGKTVSYAKAGAKFDVKLHSTGSEDEILNKRKIPGSM